MIYYNQWKNITASSDKEELSNYLILTWQGPSEKLLHLLFKKNKEPVKPKQMFLTTAPTFVRQG